VILLISILFLAAPLIGNLRSWLANRKSALPNDGEL